MTTSTYMGIALGPNADNAYDIDVALSGTSADKAFCVTVVDTNTSSSGYNYGLYVNVTQDGVKTGTAESIALGADLAIWHNVAHAFCVSLYTSVSGSPTIDYIDGIMLYMDTLGSATVNREYGISLEMVSTVAPTESGFIYLYRHGTGTVDACIRMERASGSPNGTATYFIKAPASGVIPFETGDVTSGKTCFAGLRCILGSTVGVIPLYGD